MAAADTHRPRRSGAAAPFLKWAGGKRQLLGELHRFVPPSFGAYTEAFLGSGALFFNLAGRGRLESIPITLIDSNDDLVGTYLALARESARVIARLRALERLHASRGSHLYYEVRDLRFNRARRRRRAAGLAAPYPASLAAQLIYLNRTGFNGLFRLNSRGEFNVPAGRYASPRICDVENLQRAAALLGRSNVSIVHGTFERLLDSAVPGEFVYFDPPYAPVSETAHFRSYTPEGFGVEDQRRLQQVVIALARRGCSVLVSNSVAPLIRQLYDENADARRAGLRAYRVLARRAINSDASARGRVEEYLVSNVRPSPAALPGAI